MPRTPNAELLSSPFRVLAAIAAEILSAETLSWQLGVEPQEIGRQIKLLRSELGVLIADNGCGGLEVQNWGIVDRDRFLAFVARREAKNHASARRARKRGSQKLISGGSKHASNS